jgi:hypothetical protein
VRDAVTKRWIITEQKDTIPTEMSENNSIAGIDMQRKAATSPPQDRPPVAKYSTALTPLSGTADVLVTSNFAAAYSMIKSNLVSRPPAAPSQLTS